MMTKKILTRELITEHPAITSYLPVARTVHETIDGRVCGAQRLPFLALIADMMREKFPERFCYLEIGTLFGSSLCAVSFHQKTSKYEKYAGIDVFTYYGEEVDPESKIKVSIDRADRNIRYFGVKNFALFEGDSHDQKVSKRALTYLRNTIHLLYLDGDHTDEGTAKDFAMYSPAVAPGAVVIFDDYHNNDWPGVTEFVDGIDKDGWNVVGPMTVDKTPTIFVMQREEVC